MTDAFDWKEQKRERDRGVSKASGDSGEAKSAFWCCRTKKVQYNRWKQKLKLAQSWIGPKISTTRCPQYDLSPKKYGNQVTTTN